MISSKTKTSITMCKVLPRTLKVVKENIDFLYECTIGEGTKGGFTKHSTRTKKVLAILVKRGIITREGHYKEPIYRWVANSAPTKALYQSVAEEMVTKEREIVRRSRDKKKAMETKGESVTTVEEKMPVNTIATETQNTLLIDELSDNVLWCELKRRGWDIEDNKLVKVSKQYMD